MKIVYKNLEFYKVSNTIQVFPEICKYSCSKKGEVRNFILYREFYHLKVFKKEFKLIERVKVECDNCKWKAKVPANFAKKAFKNGLKSHLLLDYSKNKILSSWIINAYASLWKVTLYSFGILICLTIVKYFINPINTGNVSEITFDNAYDPSNIGKIVKIKGKVDYTLALLKTTHIKGDDNDVLSKEVYLPLFATSGHEKFIVIKGGNNDYSNVLARKDITNLEVLKNQDYEITGKLELFNSIKNVDLRQYFGEELPVKKNFKTPELVINSVDVKTLSAFIIELIPYYVLILTLFITSISLQFYIDKKLYKAR